MKRAITIPIFFMILLSVLPVYSITYERIDAPEFDLTHLDRIAILPFEPGYETAYEGEAIADRLATHLAQEGFLNLIERMQIEKVMEEGAFSREAFADSASASGFGKLLGADAVIIGRIETRYSEKKDTTWVWQDKKVLVWVEGRQVEKTVREQVKVPVLVKSGEVNIDTKVVEVETGRILASKVAYHNWEKRGVEDKEINALPSQHDVIEDCVAKCMDILIRAYTPHKVVIERELRPKSHATTEEMQAKKLAESGFYAEAIKIFEDVLADKPKKNDIRGNLACINEAMGNFEKANYWLNEAARNGKTVHDIDDYRNSMLQAWYFIESKKLADKPIIVLDIVGDKVYLDAGLKRAIKVGTRLQICRETKIMHPVTGEEMGSDKRPVALIEITEVQEKMAVAKVIELYDDELKIMKLDVAILQ
ncbi:hypothetical protein J7L05_09490 [bacterium]|nr:hypothetical protein [bacterium]